MPYRQLASSIYLVAFKIGCRVSVTWHELDAPLSPVWPSVAHQASHDPSMSATKVGSNAGTKS